MVCSRTEFEAELGKVPVRHPAPLAALPMGFFVPGTWSGCVLRLAQALFSAASGVTMLKAYGNLAYSGGVYGYFVLVMLIQSASSSIQSGIYLYYLIANKDMDSVLIAFLLVAVDTIISLLSFSCVTALFVRDMKICRSVVFGFVAWSLEATSALSMFCLLVALVSRHAQ